MKPYTQIKLNYQTKFHQSLTPFSTVICSQGIQNISFVGLFIHLWAHVKHLFIYFIVCRVVGMSMPQRICGRQCPYRRLIFPSAMWFLGIEVSAHNQLMLLFEGPCTRYT